MLELNIESLGATYYAGNLHKWTCGPRGSAFVWVRPDRQQNIHPAVISHLYEQGLAAEFSWQGTRDLSAWLAVPRAIDFLDEIGWESMRSYNHQLTLWGRQHLASAWNVHSVASPKLLGSMATLPLPGKLRNLMMKDQPALQQRLYSEHAVEAPLIVWNDQGYVRICCQIYNSADDINRLASAIIALERSLI
jgi:isopenicillin-N epimerase